jgi:hypothetical protein
MDKTFPELMERWLLTHKRKLDMRIFFYEGEDGAKVKTRLGKLIPRGSQEDP